MLLKNKYVNQFNNFENNDESEYILPFKLDIDDEYRLSFLCDLISLFPFNIKELNKNKYFRMTIERIIYAEYNKSFFGCLDSELI